MTNDVKCQDFDYIDFIIASPKLFSCTEAALVQPEGPDPPAHDAFTGLLHRLEPDPATRMAGAGQSTGTSLSWSMPASHEVMRQCPQHAGRISQGW